MISKDVIMLNETGLHTRPASVLVGIASKFKCNIFIYKNGKKANAKSIINILALGISKGTTITITTEGSDEQEAMDALVELVEAKFGEE